MIETPDPDEEDPEPVDTLRVLLIDALMFTSRNAPDSPNNVPAYILNDPLFQGRSGIRLPLGARTMWAYSPTDGQRDMDSPSPVCRSSNGIVPWFTHLNSDVYDPRTGGMVKIGSHVENGALVRDPYPCLTCQLAQFLKDENGKWLPPVCGQTFEYVLYLVDYDMLATIRGNNRGIQLALEGAASRKRDTDPAVWNNEDMLGIRAFFQEFTEQPGITMTRPQGMVDAEHLDRPIYPVVMYLTLNNFPKKPTIIPDFVVPDGNTGSVLAYGNQAKKVNGPADAVRKKITLTNQPLTMEELGKYLLARAQYHNDAMRVKLMSLDDIQPRPVVHADVAGALAAGDVPEQAQAQLPPPWTEGEIQVDDDDDDEDED